MKRKIFVLFLVCVLMLGAIPAHAAQAVFGVHVQASQKEAAVGDTVQYTVVAEGEDVVALQFNLLIPDGMQYVPNSAATPEGLKGKLGVAVVGWMEESMMFTYYNDAGVTIPEGTVLLTFSCTAKTVGSHQVTLEEVLPFNSEFIEFAPTVQQDTLKVSNEAPGNVEGETFAPDEVEGETSAPNDVQEQPEQETVSGPNSETHASEPDETVSVDISATVSPEETIPDGDEPVSSDEQVPVTTAPDTQLPQETVPDVQLPPETAPDDQISVTTAPDSQLPQETVPDVQLPTETGPDEQVPATTNPGAQLPQETAPNVSDLPLTPEVSPDIQPSQESGSAEQQTHNTTSDSGEPSDSNEDLSSADNVKPSDDEISNQNQANSENDESAGGVALWIALAVVGAAVIIAVILLLRKKRG